MLLIKLLYEKQKYLSGLQEEQGPFTGTPIVIIQNDKQEKCACPCKAHPSKPDKCPGPGIILKSKYAITKLYYLYYYLLSMEGSSH